MSEASGQVSTGIPADAATCADCLRELLDPKDRRYRYPFLNCTNCGPRFTITRRIPYDRPQTSMARFTMCAACQAEYDDPDQPALPCAAQRLPSLRAARLAGCARRHGDSVGRSGDCETIDRLMAGEIMAIKGIGGFHLAVDATNESAVMRLRERKHRYGKPLAVMVRDLEAARELCVLTPAGRRTAAHRRAAHCPCAASGQAAASHPRSRREFRGWESFCLMRHCSICSLPILVSGRW